MNYKFLHRLASGYNLPDEPMMLTGDDVREYINDFLEHASLIADCLRDVERDTDTDGKLEGSSEITFTPSIMTERTLGC